ETLELLEELLAEFDGTLILVSHDREFLDQVVTSTLVFEADGCIEEYVGGYSDWLRQRPAPAVAEAPKPKPQAATAERAPEPRKKLSFKEQRELESLPGRIEALESRQAGLNVAINSADFYRQDNQKVQLALAEAAALQQELEKAYARWDALEALSTTTKG
ncbi:MAG: ABC transporter ATP-binding protein, partial [Methylococcaceae bacterium]|nr:ABC transporter ATP-binding protein [Methylococcaceae bacterium]